jgi:formamidopyrimidine-DNA glycosylase
MPELPEVETVRLGLLSLLPGKTVQAVSSNTPKIFPNAQHDVDQFLVGASVRDIRRRAKVLIIDLDNDYSLIIHLKMTGQLVFRANDDSARFGAGHPNDSLIGALPDKTTHVIFDFGDSKLFFNDQRKFGWVRLLPTIEIPEIDFFRKFGPEPLADDFTAADFIKRLEQRPRSNIKAVLLDQAVIAGIGNIYADESLFAAQVHPLTLVKNIPKTNKEKLFHELQAVLRLSLEKGGATEENYVNAKGEKGSYQLFAKVYHRDGQPCLVCGTIIEKSRVAGRGTHTCPTCQPKPKEKNEKNK